MALSESAMARAETNIRLRGRTLEQMRLEAALHSGSKGLLLDHLCGYQNLDGGFGHGLEPDFILPHSSVLATTVAFQIMDEIANTVDEFMVESAIGYLIEVFDPQRGGWWSVPPTVNDYPHAPWWQHRPGHGTTIDAYWGNPSAEVIGILWNHRQFVDGLDVDALAQDAIDRLLEMDTFASCHELYCFLRMVDRMPDKLVSDVIPILETAVASLMTVDEAQWTTYSAEPRFFLRASPTRRLGLDNDAMERNIGYLERQLEANGSISINWDWSGAYPDEWVIAQRNWEAIHTLEALIILYSR